MDVAYAKIFVWHKLVKDLAELKSAEIKLREEIAKEFFANPKEGSNTLAVTVGVKLKFTHKLNRKIDKSTLQATLKTMPEGSEDLLIEYKPELRSKVYKELAEETRKIFESTLITKPATPNLKLIIKEEDGA